MNIMPGNVVLRLMDEHGVPFELIQDRLREENSGFDVLDFLKSCEKNPNYGLEKGYKILIQYNDNSEVIKLIKRLIVENFK